MPNPRKHFDSGGLYFITSRTEEGLPFLDCSRFKPIFLSILARGQTLYPVRISNYCLMANHFHLLLIPIDPDNIPLFMKYIKQEMAHALNKLRGRKKRTVWCDGYDSPRIISYHKAIKYFSYINLQPVAAGICRDEKSYKGASAVLMQDQEKVERSFYRRYRPKIEDEDTEIIHTLIIEPLAWKEALAPELTTEKVLQDIALFTNEKRASLIATKAKHGKGFYVEPIETDDNEDDREIKKNAWVDGYIPTSRGIRMRVIGDNNKARILYICYLLRQEALCKNLYKKWGDGPHSLDEWPPGFFMPSLPRKQRALAIQLKDLV
jgi:REP element-mobilizing transposase RayT